ncbi:MAG: M56 family metallopeptidase, partial [Gammaproteobacteria bacterium]
NPHPAKVAATDKADPTYSYTTTPQQVSPPPRPLQAEPVRTTASSPATETVAPVHVDPLTMALAAWLAGTALALLRLAAAGWISVRRLASRTSVHGGPAADCLAELLADSGHGAAVRLSTSDVLDGPVSLPGREIVVPGWCLRELEPRQLRAMLAHELAHCLHRDPEWQLIGAVTQAVLFPQLLLSLVRRRLELIAELCADDWAATHLGDGRALAECLASCAERLLASKPPALTTAMAVPHSPLRQRVTRLLAHDPTIQGEPEMKTRLALFAGLAAFALCAPQLAVSANAGNGKSKKVETLLWVNTGDHPGYYSNVSGHNGVYDIDFRMDGRSVKAHAEGVDQITFNADESDVAHLGVDSALSIETTIDDTTRRIEFTPGSDGKVERKYAVNGKTHALDVEGRRWLARAIPDMLRISGLMARQRVASLLKKGGPDAVLDEIHRIPGGHVIATYAELLADKSPLNGAQLDRLLDELGRVPSAYELRRSLSTIYATQKPTGEAFKHFVKLAHGITSSFEMRTLLETLAAHAGKSDEFAHGYLELAETIDSSFELRQALAALLNNAPPRVAARALDSAASKISSDFELRQLLVSFAPRVGDSDALAQSYANASRDIGSSFERRNALVALVEHAKPGRGGWLAILDAASGIGSDYERATALVDMAAQLPDDKEVIARFRAVMNDIGSRHERERVEAAWKKARG